MLHGGALILHLHTLPHDKDSIKQKPLVVRVERERERKITKQIVQSSESDRREVKEDAYLSDKTRSFDRQTRARVVDKFNETNSRKKGKKSNKDDLKLSDLGAGTSDHPLKQAAEEYTKEKNGDSGKASHNKVSSTSDYVKDIPLGDLTELNTVEYKYYGFYHRIRQKLEQFWGRSLHAKAEEMARAGRRVPGSEELITALIITLDQDGEVINIQIKGSSGIKELDDAAIESFNEAGPFPNPPDDLIVDGKVTLEWGFVVKS